MIIKLFESILSSAINRGRSAYENERLITESNPEKRASIPDSDVAIGRTIATKVTEDSSAKPSESVALSDETRRRHIYYMS
jgi:hypothetical protein